MLVSFNEAIHQIKYFTTEKQFGFGFNRDQKNNSRKNSTNIITKVIVFQMFLCLERTPVHYNWVPHLSVDLRISVIYYRMGIHTNDQKKCVSCKATIRQVFYGVFSPLVVHSIIFLAKNSELNSCVIYSWLYWVLYIIGLYRLWAHKLLKIYS